MRILLSCLLLSFLAASARAQPYRSDLLSLAAGGIYNQVLLYRLDAAGQWTILEAFAASRRPGTLTHHTDNRNLVLADNNPFAVILFDPATGTTLARLHSGSPLRDVLAVRPFHTGGYVVAEGLTASAVHLVAADGSALVTLLRQADRINAVGQDLSTGEVLVGLSSTSGPCLIRLDPQSGRVTPLDPAPRVVRSLVQDHRDGSIYYGTADDAIFRLDPQGGVSTFVPGNNAAGVQAASLAFDRAAGEGILVAGGTRRIARLDFAPGGAPAVVVVHGELPQNPLAAADLAFQHGRNVSSRRVGSGNRWAFDLSFPGEAGNGYVLAFSASGFTPGVPLGARTLPLVADAILVASVTGGLAPLLQGNSGRLDGDGRATAAADLSALSGLAGLRLWAAAVTLDPAAPAGIRTISKPIVFVLE